MERFPAAALVAFTILVAGCLGPLPGSEPLDAGQATDALGAAGRVVLHDTSGLLGQDTLAARGLAVPAIGTGYRLVGHVGAEPNIGITSQGTILITAADAVMRSQDAGATWEDVVEFDPPPPFGGGEKDNGDPMLWVDADTDRIFSTPAWPGLTCASMLRSDDEGDTWDERHMACGLPGLDHPKTITARPGPDSAWPMQGYPNVVFLCYNKIVASTNCAVSIDGGDTFVLDNSVDNAARCGGGVHHPAASLEGVVYVPFRNFCDTLQIGVTYDSGLTYTVRDTGLAMSNMYHDSDIAVTPDGTLYATYIPLNDNGMWAARSRDEARTWEGPWRISPPDITSTTFPTIVAGDDGRVGFAYLGVRDGDGANAENVPDDARWHLYYTFTETAGATDPLFVTAQVTPEEDPVQVGCVYLGGAIGDSDCRNLLDFIDMAIDPQGRVYIAYTEGCIGECIGKADAQGSDSRAQEVAVAYLDHGPSLRAEMGLLPRLDLAPAAPQVASEGAP